MKTNILSLLYVITTYCTITSALLAKDTPIDIAESKLLYKDDFNGDLSQWVIEQMTGGTTTIKNEQLDINDAKGCTVWFKHKLTGAIMIEFEASLIKKGGQYDRLSDLNCFWMATDPKNPKDLFANQKRGGLFKNYHPLRLYYVGYGANHNTTTRFRRYPGDSSRPCLPGHDLQDKKFMHTANKTIKIQIIAKDSKIQYLRDGVIVFNFTDKAPYSEGWFGLRTVNNHMKIDNFRVHQLATPTPK
ncbi:MAG: DUF6250 domain-containing protein [Akkermansiaceae bacterium]|jgi:hypothetical protein|tara:strand:- start:44765 stop:45499 length:735 start_codon:yes stop_codon:yes gene_type:complete